MKEQGDLRQTFEEFWKVIRGARLYAGQPRSVESQSGVALARRAVRLADSAGDEAFRLEACWMLAHSLAANEQWADAIPFYREAIDGYTRRADDATAARLRIGYVAVLTAADRFDDALSAAKEAEAWISSHNDSAAYARLCTNIGNLYRRFDNHQLACDYYLSAVRTFEASGNRQAAAQVYLDLANAYSMLDRFEESETMYAMAEGIAEELQLRELWAQASYNHAYLLFLRGLYGRALQEFSKLRKHFKDSGSDRHAALCDLDEAEIYLQLDVPHEAAALSDRASREFLRLGMAYERAKALAFHGAALAQMRRADQALATFANARQVFEAENNQYWMAAIDLYSANVLLERKRYDQAQALAAGAAGRYEGLGIPSRRMLSLVMLGEIALAVGDLQAAEIHAAAVEALAEAARVPLLLFPYHLLCGQIAELKGHSDRAAQAYALAAGELETHHSRIHHDKLRVAFLQGRNHVYESLVRLSLDSDPKSISDAYAWCERAKSRGLAALLEGHMDAVSGRGDHALLRRADRLREELNLQYVRSEPEKPNRSSTPRTENILLKEQELAAALHDVALSDPEYASLQAVDCVGLERVKEIAGPETTIVEFFIAADEIMAFVVSRENTAVFRQLASAEHVRTLQEKLSFQLEKFLLGGDYVRVHSAQILEAANYYLHQLYAALVEPLVEDVQTPCLTIIPHGALHFMPLHALFDGNGGYLTDRFEITYAPSASVLRHCAQKADVPDAAPLILGVADAIAPLVEEEAAGVSALFPDARTLLGAAATRPAFAEAAKEASFIHVATHATFRQDSPMFSNFRLADGYVTATDLFSMTCKTNLVALSACKSGLNVVSGGDDLLGLTRGFLYAGARSLLLSLWSVSDESTLMLMKEFYTHWRKGTRKSAALQAAMREVRRAYPNPYFWAPFVLVGKA